VLAVRTLLHLKALEKIPDNGSISLQDLAKATGAQESLLGPTTPGLMNVPGY
jgi:hypothetical protein